MAISGIFNFVTKSFISDLNVWRIFLLGHSIFKESYWVNFELLDGTFNAKLLNIKEAKI